MDDNKPPFVALLKRLSEHPLIVLIGPATAFIGLLFAVITIVIGIIQIVPIVTGCPTLVELFTLQCRTIETPTPEVAVTPPTPTVQTVSPEPSPPSTATIPVPTAMPVSRRIVYQGDPRQDQEFCRGFQTDCIDGNCALGERIVYGPYCRAYHHRYIVEPAMYRVTISGYGRVIAGATDFGPKEEEFRFGHQEMTLPGSFEFCWPGLDPDGFGFETIVKSAGGTASVNWLTIEIIREGC